MVLVDLATAMICFLGQCYPVLVGPTTPVGEYKLEHVLVNGKSRLAFKETDTSVFSVHSVYLGKPSEHRMERLQSKIVKDRQVITNGCVNVMPKVYQELMDCCRSEKIVIR